MSRIAKPTGTYACPYCGKDSPHRHETRLGQALPRLFEALRQWGIVCSDPFVCKLELSFERAAERSRVLRELIIDVKVAYQSQFHEPLTALEGMEYDKPYDE